MSVTINSHKTIEVFLLPQTGRSGAIRVEGWGYLPEFSLVGACGLLLVVFSYNGARASASWAEPLFWMGLSVIFVPILARLFALRTTGRRERLGLLLVLSLMLNLAYLLQYPLAFTQFDEFDHWRTALDIASTNHLFHDNPLLPISPFYPGLEILTNAMSNLTGLSIFISGHIVVCAAELLQVLVLYLFLELLVNSPHLAGIATAIYMTNPHYLFFDGEFAYESIALPIAFFVLFVVARAVRQQDSLQKRIGFLIVAIFGLWSVVVTHHLTSYALLGFLLLWMLASLFRSRRTWDSLTLGSYVLLGIASIFFWLVFTQLRALGYLGPILISATHQLQLILSGESATRQLFHDYAGTVTPLWQRMVAIASVALILLGIVPGLYWVWQHRANAAVVAITLCALLYPPSQALRLSQAGIEVADRATEFVFLGISMLIAIGAAPLTMGAVRRNLVVGVLVIGATTLFLGGVVAGSGPDWERLPGPFLVTADPRSVTPVGIAAAQWAAAYLGPGRSVATDRVNSVLMATYGQEHAVTTINDQIEVAPLFTSTTFDATDNGLIRSANIEYLVVDQRLSEGLPRLGFYFDEVEPSAFQYTAPLSPQVLTKFDGISGVDRVFDSVDIVIYDTGALLDGG